MKSKTERYGGEKERKERGKEEDGRKEGNYRIIFIPEYC